MDFVTFSLFTIYLISKINSIYECGAEYEKCDRCCSMYNWCGDSQDHCGYGCQYKYSDHCNSTCPDNSKTLMNNDGCIEYCGKDDSIYKYEYYNICYDECPDNLKLIEEKNICIDDCKDDDTYIYTYNSKCYMQCPNNNFLDNETKYCYDEIPEGYYCNDTQTKIIYKCHEDCKECNGPATNNNNNCLKCWDKFFDLGNCTDNCKNGYYNDDNNNKICYCPNIKCLICSQESKEINKCLSCNKAQGYYQKRDDIISNALIFDCYKNLEGYYLSNEYIFEKCYEICKSCFSKGDENDNKCLECSEPYILIKDFENQNNCYNICEYNYYYDKLDNNQYKCTISNNCPANYTKFIPNKKRCIDECENDNIYKYEHESKCYKTCPRGTLLSYNNICTDINKDEPLLLNMALNFTVNNIPLDYINSLNKEYLNQVGDLSNVVYKGSNEHLNVYIYKDSSALEQLDNEAPIIDFGNCYDKVKKFFNINDYLIVTIINNETNKETYGKATNQYLFSFPDSGDPIDTTDICDENDIIIITEDLKNLMEGLDPKKVEDILFFTKQGINVFNISDRFYNDLCFYYESPNNKDIPLKDKISNFFPNLTLCDPGCESKGVDLDKMKVKCECFFNDILSNEIINNLSGGFLDEIMNIISSMNIEVLKCFNNIFDKKCFKRTIGGFIIMGLLCIKLVCIFKYIYDKLSFIKQHIFSLSDSFFSYVEKNIKEPPKKNRNKGKNRGKNKSKTNISKNISSGFKDNCNSQNSNNIFIGTFRKNSKQNTNLIDNKNQTYKLEKKDKNGECILDTKNDPNQSNQYILFQIKNYLIGSYDENDFLDVLDKEKRTFCEYFSIKYKKNQIIINTFFVNEKFKPITINKNYFIYIDN